MEAGGSAGGDVITLIALIYIRFTCYCVKDTLQKLHHEHVTLYVAACVGVCVWMQYIEGKHGLVRPLQTSWNMTQSSSRVSSQNHNEAALMISTWIPTSSQLGPIGAN